MNKTKVTIRIPHDLIEWSRETFVPLMKIGFSPTDSQIITHALMQLKSNWCEEDIEMVVNKNKILYKR